MACDGHWSFPVIAPRQPLGVYLRQVASRIHQKMADPFPIDETWGGNKR